MLSDKINLVPDEKAVISLVERFEKLLRKYARLLEYEDAYNDLLLFFIELLHKLKNNNTNLQNDGAIVNYISKAIKNHYICLSKNRERVKAIAFSDMTPAQMLQIESKSAKTGTDKFNEYFPIGNKLSEWEKLVLTLFFFEGYTSADIATMFGKTRQAVNQTKLKALKKIKLNNGT